MTSTPPPSANNVRRQAFLRQASAPVIDSKKPTLVHRWLHAQENGKGWSTFGLRDSGHLEKAWLSFQETEKGKSVEKQGSSSKSTEKEEMMVMEPPDPDVPLPIWRVPVAEDRLFEVDLRTFKLWPVFWKGKGSEVLRGSWFFDSSKISPCIKEVAKELEDLYHSIKPWLPSYADELKSAVSLGADAEQKLRAPMTSLKGSYVIFLGPFLARIYSDDVTSRMTKTLWTAWSGAHGGGTLVARGFDNARRLLRTRENKKPVSRSVKKSGHKLKDSSDLRGSPNSSPKVSLSHDTDTPTAEGAAEPTTTSNLSKEEEEEATMTAKASTDAGAADMLRSLATKFGTWGSMSPKRASRISEKTQNDIKKAFNEAQSRMQGVEIGSGQESTRQSLEGMASTGLQAGFDDSSEKEEQDLTAEEEVREEEEELKREQERDNQQCDLCIVWHGIGQKLAEADEWRSLDFTLAVTSLRVLAQKRQASAPPSDVGGGGFPVLGEGRRVQFLPVLWRATLQDFEPPASDEQVNPEEHLTNQFSKTAYQWDSFRHSTLS
jgi:hypothetical protein